MHQSANFCHACGYELIGHAADAVCPECGAQQGDRAACECSAWARRPCARAARVARGGFMPVGWWALLPASFARRARVELVVSLLVTTIAFGAYFGVGSHVMTISSYSTVKQGQTDPSLRLRAYQVSQAPLALLARADDPRAVFGGPVGYQIMDGPSTPPDGPRSAGRFGMVEWCDSPFLLARVSWLSCAPALAFLALRFALLPVAVRLGGSRRCQPAAADLATASCAVACAGIAIALGSGLFVAIGYLPVALSDPLATVAPIGLGAWLVMGPPLLFANQIRGDHSRRVFPRPALTALASVVVYLAALALTLVAMGLTFRAALWLMSP